MFKQVDYSLALPYDAVLAAVVFGVLVITYVNANLDLVLTQSGRRGALAIVEFGMEKSSK